MLNKSWIIKYTTLLHTIIIHVYTYSILHVFDKTQLLLDICTTDLG